MKRKRSYSKWKLGEEPLYLVGALQGPVLVPHRMFLYYIGSFPLSKALAVIPDPEVRKKARQLFSEDPELIIRGNWGFIGPDCEILRKVVDEMILGGASNG